MSDDDAIPQGSYTARGKERIKLWKHDLTDLAKDTGKQRCAGDPAVALHASYFTKTCMRGAVHCTLSEPSVHRTLNEPYVVQIFWRFILQQLFSLCCTPFPYTRTLLHSGLH